MNEHKIYRYSMHSEVLSGQKCPLLENLVFPCFPQIWSTIKRNPGRPKKLKLKKHPRRIPLLSISPGPKSSPFARLHEHPAKVHLWSWPGHESPELIKGVHAALVKYSRRFKQNVLIIEQTEPTETQHFVLPICEPFFKKQQWITFKHWRDRFFSLFPFHLSH